MARFTEPQEPWIDQQHPSMTWLALPPGTPTNIPLALSKSVNGVASWETLFSFQDAEGQPMAAAYPATYDPYMGIQAGRR